MDKKAKLKEMVKAKNGKGGPGFKTDLGSPFTETASTDPFWSRYSNSMGGSNRKKRVQRKMELMDLGREKFDRKGYSDWTKGKSWKV